MGAPWETRARKWEYDPPPTPKPREEGQPSINEPRPIFQLFGAYCHTILYHIIPYHTILYYTIIHFLESTVPTYKLPTCK